MKNHVPQTASPIATKAEFKLDAKKSTIKWTGKKILGSHWGYIQFSTGNIQIEKDHFKSGQFFIDMNSIDNQDLTPETGRDMLLGHLKSDDFFAVATHPTADLKLKSVTPAADHYNIVADLTLKGIMHEMHFPAKVVLTEKRLTATADFKINRTKWGIKYGSGSFFADLGDKAIRDEFQVEIQLVANILN
jgi:polyisoprenoid-binding protein YceI